MKHSRVLCALLALKGGLWRVGAHSVPPGRLLSPNSSLGGSPTFSLNGDGASVGAKSLSMELGPRTSISEQT